MNRIDQNLLSDLSSINSNYSSNNLLENYKYQNNYSTTADFNNNNDDYDEENEEFSNFLTESNDEDDAKPNAEQLNLNRKDVLIQLERKKRKVLESKLKQLQASMKKKQQQDNEKLCKKLSTSLSMQSRNSLQNRRFDGDGSEDDLNPGPKTNLISTKNKLNYQSYSNNCPNNFRNQYSNQNNDLNDLNEYSTSSHNLKVKEIDKLIKIIKQQQQEPGGKQLINDDRNSLNSRSSMKHIKNNLINATGGSVNLDNQAFPNSMDYCPTTLHNDLYLNENNLKRQIINSMKTNFNSMIEFIENQSFSQDHFMAIQQLINLIMMQNCQFMNHQQVLLCWLQKLQLCASRPNQSYFTNNHFTNNLHSIDATGDCSLNQFNENQLNDQLNATAQPHLNNHKLTPLNNQQQIDPNVKQANNFYDNLKSNSMYQNQLGNSKMKNSPVQNYKLNNNKLNKNSTPTADKLNVRASNEFKELYYLIEQLIENREFKQQNATGKLSSFHHQEFDEPGAVGGEVDAQKIGELNLNDLTDNHHLHQNNNIKQSTAPNGTGSLVNNSNLTNNVNTANHLTNGASSSTVTNTNAANKSPQMINLHLQSSTSAVRKKTTNPPTIDRARKNPDVIESINIPDDLIKNSETIRPFSAAEGRSSTDPSITTTILQNQVKSLNNATSSKMNSAITSSTSINSTSIVVAPASSTNSTNTSHSLLLKRPPTTGASRLNNNANFANDDNETETETDDDLAISNQNQTPEVNSSENENNVNSSTLPNTNQIVESSTIDPEQQIDEQLGFGNSHLNVRNDSEIRLSGDGEQGL